MTGNDICRICGSKSVNRFKINSFRYIKCPGCGIVYLCEFPDRSALDDYYKKEYIISQSDWISSEKRRIFRLPEQISLINRISEYIKPGSDFLDIGCDKGYFLDELRRAGYNCTGVEPSDSAREYCRNISLDVYPSLQDIQSKFNACSLWHVLEHSEAPLTFLNDIRNILKDNGFIFIRVPDFGSIYRKIFKDKWIWLQPNNHYFQYTKESIEYLLNKTGFKTKIIKSQKPNTHLTNKMYHISNNIFSGYSNPNNLLINYFKRKYEDCTGVEIFCIAVKI